MENKDFIVTSLQSWDIEIGSAIKNTALEISKKNRVIYVNTPLDYATWLKGDRNKSYQHRMDVLKKRVPSIRQINKNFWVIDCPFIIHSINKIPFDILFDFVNKLNNKKIASRIQEAISDLGFRDCIHLIDTDIYRSQYLNEYLQPELSIYYCRDFVIGESYWKKHGTRLEPLLAAKSDIVLVNSTHFADRFRSYNINTYAIETGVDLTLYDASKKWEIPDELRQIGHPIIGYVGTLNSTRLDIDLLQTLAMKCKNYNFVFTGPEDDLFAKHPIHEMKNVYFLGKKTVDQLPAYITGYDVCINPQIVNNITDGNYPLKIDEYLAMGKPTVATSTHTMRDVFKDHTFLPTNEEEYIQAFERALAEINDDAKKEERIRFAHTHGWSNSVDKIYTIIECHRDIKRYINVQ